jgi:hypothetical protein
MQFRLHSRFHAVGDHQIRFALDRRVTDDSDRNYRGRRHQWQAFRQLSIVAGVEQGLPSILQVTLHRRFGKVDLALPDRLQDC